jgi:nitrite reductase (NADH) large subunit
MGVTIMHAEILIVGAGPAGFNAAKAARKSGRQVVLAGAEPFLPYWRPRLPDIIHTGAAVTKILMQDADWFQSAVIRFLPSKKATGIDLSKKSVWWEDGNATEYDTLIFACGSSPNIPSVPFTDRVYPLRTYEDAIVIRRECMRTHKAFIVGGGVLGLETAFAVSQLGIHVTVYDIGAYPLPRQLDREGGLFLKKRLEDKGIVIHTGATLGDFRGDMEGACVIAAAGVRPVVELAKQCGIATNRGIIVDDHMRTSVRDIYACGDIAEFSGTMPGLMTVATKQGETAGLNASGGNSVYRPVLPAPMTKVAGIAILAIGSVQVADGARIYRQIHSNSYAMAVVDAGKITGAAFIGDISPGMKFKKWMGNGGEIGGVASYEDIEKTLGQM